MYFKLLFSTKHIIMYNLFFKQLKTQILIIKLNFQNFPVMSFIVNGKSKEEYFEVAKFFESKTKFLEVTKLMSDF